MGKHTNSHTFNLSSNGQAHEQSHIYLKQHKNKFAMHYNLVTK